MSELLTPARPYAKAIYEISAKKDASAWLPIMQVCKALGDNQNAENMLSSHKITLEHLNTFLSGIFSKLKINDIPQEFNDFLTILAKNKRFVLLPSIAELFMDEFDKSKDVVSVEIISAKDLSKENKDSLIKNIENKLKKSVKASVTIDESLIGGVVIRYGDTVIDGSIKGKLEQLTNTLI